MGQLVSDEQLHFRLQAVLSLTFSVSCASVGSMYINYEAKLTLRDVALSLLMENILYHKPSGVHAC